MIVDDLYIIGVSIMPPKANAPLIVNSDAVLSQSVSAQRFQPISGRHSERMEVWRRINHP